MIDLVATGLIDDFTRGLPPRVRGEVVAAVAMRLEGNADGEGDLEPSEESASSLETDTNDRLTGDPNATLFLTCVDGVGGIVVPKAVLGFDREVGLTS